MNDRPRSRTQRFFATMLGAEAAAAMEAESRAWLITCPHCGFARSIWDVGGVRYKSSGSSWVGTTCPRCGRSGWHKVARGPNFPPSSGPVWPLVRMIAIMVLAILLVVATILLSVFRLTGLI